MFFHCFAKTVVGIEMLSVTKHQIKFIQKYYSSKFALQKQLWLEMDCDMILHKPDLNT